MTTPKRSLPFKNLVVEPLNWVAPKSAAEDHTRDADNHDNAVSERDDKS